MILVDTSVLIDFFKGIDNHATSKFEYILKNTIPFGINSFIFQELLQGAKTDKEFATLKKYLITQRFYYMQDPIRSFEKAAKIYFDCRRKGITIRSTIDCLIAQTTVEYNLYLLHNDSDFVNIAKVVSLKFY